MNYTTRTYEAESDKLLLSALARRFFDDHLHVIDLPYRLSSWALDDPGNTRLWFDAQGNLLAWAVLQTPFWFVDYVCDPQDMALHGEILAWADTRSREIAATPAGHLSWFVNVFDGQTERIRDLQAVGFACQSDPENVPPGDDPWSKVFMRREANMPVGTYRLPAGFTLRPLGGESEVGAYVELHRAVFESKSMTIEWRQRILRHPAYQPDLDIVIAAPDGSLAAFCVGWLDQATGRGHIESLGCREDCRRYALGRVALAEVLRRLQARGAQAIYVETDKYRNTALALYEHMGFDVIRDVLVYRKDYE